VPAESHPSKSVQKSRKKSHYNSFVRNVHAYKLPDNTSYLQLPSNFSFIIPYPATSFQLACVKSMLNLCKAPILP
jgi:hypothetical protein